MTKSGIGTNAQNGMNTLMSNGSNHNLNASNGNLTNTNGGNTNTAGGLTSTASLIANAEIPIWVADKKKWVTGISKRTTVNDLIYAILKQCQIVNNPSQSNNETNNTPTQDIASQYVLLEYNFDSLTNESSENQSANAQHQPQPKIIDGDSKVYKYLNKWSQSTAGVSSASLSNSNILLKILQRMPLNDTNNQSNSDNHLNNHNQQSTSLASKLLKKIGVSSSGHANHPANSASTLTSAAPSSASSYRYVDVKLPKAATSTLFNSSKPSASPAPPPTPTGQQVGQPQSSGAVNRNFDPNIQKSFITNTIVERENRLKQQRERFQIIDEMIRETEKKSKNQSSQFFNFNTSNGSSGGNHQPSTQSLSPSQLLMGHLPQSSLACSNSVLNQQQQQLINNLKQNNLIDINDIYCNFPEMCTHNLNEVEEFQRMCCQLFQLEEAIKNQKQVLNNLEFDLQRELNNNSLSSANTLTNGVAGATNATTFLQSNNNNNISNSISPNQQILNQQPQINESPETVEVRKEVNLSREQTRLQCKQLHDLDAKMRLNEQNLMVREQQYQQLLEELYVQEIYADNALEKALTSEFASAASTAPVVTATSQPAALNGAYQQQQSQHYQSDRLILNHMLQDEFIDDECDDDRLNLNGNHIEVKITNHDFTCNGERQTVSSKLPFDEIFLLNNQLNILQQQQQQLGKTNYANGGNRGTFNNSTIQLNPQQKSLSYGNLSNTGGSGNGVNTLNTMAVSPAFENNPSMCVDSVNKMANLNPNLIKQTNKLKTSPSLELNSKSIMSRMSNGAMVNGNANGHHTSGGTDHSGDNDSGISSMSSETTAITTTSSSSSSSSSTTTKTITNSLPPVSASLQIQNGTCNSIPIINNSTATYVNKNQQLQMQQRQQIYNQQQQQLQLQQQQAAQNNKQMKSVLETLV